MSHNHYFLKPEGRCASCLDPQAVSEERNLSLGLDYRSVANICPWTCCALLERVFLGPLLPILILCPKGTELFNNFVLISMSL